jgi:hypothetical protein
MSWARLAREPLVKISRPLSDRCEDRTARKHAALDRFLKIPEFAPRQKIASSLRLPNLKLNKWLTRLRSSPAGASL